MDGLEALGAADDAAVGLDEEAAPIDEEAPARLESSVWGHFKIGTKQPGRGRRFGGFQAECRTTSPGAKSTSVCLDRVDWTETSP